MLAGTAPARAVTIPPRLAFTPPSGAYGQVAAGSTAAKKFTLDNKGRSATGALTLTKSGPGRAAFQVTADTCTATSLGPGKSCTFTVRFHPTSPVRYAATLTAVGKKPTATATLPLTGTGAAAGHLYWANGAGTIVQAGLDGSHPHAIATGQGNPWGVAVSSSHVYWTNTAAGTIVQAGLDGSHPHVIATGQGEPLGVAVSTP